MKIKLSKSFKDAWNVHSEPKIIVLRDKTKLKKIINHVYFLFKQFQKFINKSS